jgi:hypothetical protein
MRVWISAFLLTFLSRSAFCQSLVVQTPDDPAAAAVECGKITCRDSEICAYYTTSATTTVWTTTSIPLCVRATGYYECGKRMCHIGGACIVEGKDCAAYCGRGSD